MDTPLSKWGIKVVTSDQVPEGEMLLVPSWTPVTEKEREDWEKQVGRLLFGPHLVARSRVLDRAGKG